MKSSNRTKTRIFYTLIILLFLLFIGYNRWNRRSIQTNHKLSSCLIDKVKTVGREQYVLIKYHFSVDGKIYYSSVSYSQQQMSFENSKLLENKNFPVAYNIRSYNVLSYILIFPNDYKDFNIPYPDSLNWVLPLIKK